MQNSVNTKFHELAYYTLALKDEYFIHQCIVDAYTAQTANEYTKSISLTFALVGLYLLIEKNYTGKEVQNFHTLMSKNKKNWTTFILPENRGEVTIDAVLKASEGKERDKMIMIWCTSIWNAFSESHTEIKQVAESYISK